MLKFSPLAISSLQPAGDDAVAVRFALPDELRDDYVSLPGQHIVLRAEIEKVEVRRTYSLVSPGGSHTLEIGTNRWLFKNADFQLQLA